MNAIKTVLHPTDFSDHSQLALGLAAMIARDQKARLLILHVVPSTPSATGADVAELNRLETYQQDLKSYKEEMTARLSQLRTPDGAVKTEYLLQEGDAVKLILRAAADNSCDLIVMGTHGKSNYQRLMMGSVTTEVTRQAQCPVLTVKLPKPQASPAAMPALEVAGKAR